MLPFQSSFPASNKRCEDGKSHFALARPRRPSFIYTPMTRIAIPDDAPPVLAASQVWKELSACNAAHFDTLPGTTDRLIERIAGAEVVLNIRASSKFTEPVFATCPRLRLLSLWGTGTDHVDLAAAARHGVTVCNTPGVSAVSIAEHTLALLFAVARHIPQMDR